MIYAGQPQKVKSSERRRTEQKVSKREITSHTCAGWAFALFVGASESQKILRFAYPETSGLWL